MFEIPIVKAILIFFRWLRCNRRNNRHKTPRHGSISKIALAGSTIPSETSKLLVSGDVYGRHIVNPYDQV